VGFVLDQQVTGSWALYNGDAMEVMADLPDASVHLSAYSPPFAGLFHYSSSDRDLSNAGSYLEFIETYAYFVRELARVTMPGRCSAVHCMDVPAKNNDSGAFIDFPGDIIRVHQASGFDYVGRHVIWKAPLKVRNVTLAKGLAHRTVTEDAAAATLAAADYLLIFRRHGGNPVPVGHRRGFTEYFGSRRPPADVLRYRGWAGSQLENRYSHWVWRQYASSVWDDIRGNLGLPDDADGVLPFRDARDEDDERHIHPLQLDVAARCIAMRSNPGELVLSPFAGVGSEIVMAVRLGRLGIGIELKPSYFRQSVRNLAALRLPGGEQEALFAEPGCSTADLPEAAMPQPFTDDPAAETEASHDH
jgi:DNA modification methylase